MGYAMVRIRPSAQRILRRRPVRQPKAPASVRTGTGPDASRRSTPKSGLGCLPVRLVALSRAFDGTGDVPMLMQGFPPPPEQRVTLARPSGSRSRSGGGAADRTPDRWGRPGAGHGGGRAPLPVRQVRSDYVCRWSDLPRRRLVKGQQGSGLGVGEVAGAGPLGSHVAPCGRQRAQAVAGRGPGVEEHQAVHQATGPASCGWGYGRPSRRRSSSVLGCAEGAVTRHVGVFGFAGHGCFRLPCRFSGVPKPKIGVPTRHFHRTTMLRLQSHIRG
jgi:hypothetical protein